MRGIYKITNKENNKVYIGETLNILERWSTHISNLKNGSHHSYKLQSDWDLYSEEDFEFKIISVLDESIPNFIDKYILIIFEYIYIESYKSIDHGYNVENTMLKMVNGQKTRKTPSSDYKILKRYYEEYERKLLLDRGGIIYLITHKLEDIAIELNMTKDEVTNFFINSDYYSGNKKEVFREIEGVLLNKNIAKSKFDYELYLKLLKSARIYNEHPNVKPIKSITIDVKPTKTNKVNVENSERSIKNLINTVNLKVPYNTVFTILRSENILKQITLEGSKNKFNVPTELYVNIFETIISETGRSLQLRLTDESEILILETLKNHNAITMI